MSRQDFSSAKKSVWWESQGYAMRALPRNGGATRLQSLHVFILGSKLGLEIDHRNGNGLDCRRRNMRWATHSQNIANAGKRPGSSQYKGVSWMKSKGKWRAVIKLHYRQYHLGLFTNEVKAAKAYDRAAKKVFKQYAKTNF